MRFTALTSVAILAATAIAAPAIQREEKRAFLTDELGTYEKHSSK